MSCFIVPMAEAAVVSVMRKSSKIKNLSSLETMLWSGSTVLMLEHLFNGEYLPDIYEMFTVGIAMAILVTLFWFALRKFHVSKIGLALVGVFAMVATDVLFSFL